MKDHPNLKYIASLSGGDQAFETEIIQVIKKELPEEIEAYHQALLNDNFKDAADCVHKLKHKISILGMENSYQTASKFEEELKSEKKKLESHFEDILDAMIAFIEKL